MELLFEIEGEGESTYAAPGAALFPDQHSSDETAGAAIPAHHINVELVARFFMNGGTITRWTPSVECVSADLVVAATDVVVQRVAITCGDLSPRAPRAPADLHAAKSLVVRPLPSGTYKLKLVAKWQGMTLLGATSAIGTGIRLNVDGRPVWGQVYEPVPQNPAGIAHREFELVSLNP